MSHWIESPWITDTQTEQQVLSFSDPNWSLDQSRWIDDTTVELVMRKYPGNHKPSDVTVTVDLAKLTAKVGEREVGTLHELERVMDAAIDFY